MTLTEREFLFLRHGQTEYNRERRFQGHLDIPLNDQGHSQAASAADLLANQGVTQIVASPARRVQQTIAPLLQAGELPMDTEDDLMEFFVGSFEGRLIADIRHEHGLLVNSCWPRRRKIRVFCTRIGNSVGLRVAVNIHFDCGVLSSVYCL